MNCRGPISYWLCVKSRASEKCSGFEFKSSARPSRDRRMAVGAGFSLWRACDQINSFYLLPDLGSRPAGTMAIRSITGVVDCVNADWAKTFHLTEDQAHRWAK